MQVTSIDAVFGKVAMVVQQTLYLEGRALSPATRLVDDLMLGRFGRIRLAMYLEETFEVEISDEAIECFDTVGDIAHYMSRWSLGSADVSSQAWLKA
jgi:acyl carrier protein